MTRLAHLFLALSFAAIQCVAPLAHAHTGGTAEHGIHLPGTAEAQHTPADTDQMCCFETEAEESPAIVVAEGCEREQERDAASQAQAPAGPPLNLAEASTAFQARRQAVTLPPVALRKPYAQAPPSL